MALFKSCAACPEVDVQIPDGHYDIPPECIVKDGDRVANVTYGHNNTHKVMWMKVDHNEIGKTKQIAGVIVIRKI